MLSATMSSEVDRCYPFVGRLLKDGGSLLPGSPTISSKKLDFSLCETSARQFSESPQECDAVSQRSAPSRLQDGSTSNSTAYTEWTPEQPSMTLPSEEEEGDRNHGRASSPSMPSFGPKASSDSIGLPVSPVDNTNGTESSKGHSFQGSHVYSDACDLVSGLAKRRHIAQHGPSVTTDRISSQVDLTEADGKVGLRSVRASMSCENTGPSGPSSQANARIRKGTKHPVREPMRPRPNRLFFQSDGQWYHRQVKKCQTAPYSELPQCQACVSRVIGDTCRFVNIRAIASDGATAGQAAVPKHFTHPSQARLSSEDYTSLEFLYPSEDDLFPTMDEAALCAIKTTAAKALHATMESEVAHARRGDTLWRRPETEIRPQCDQCLTSLFSASYICRVCGKEYCQECAERLRQEDLPPPWPLIFRCSYNSRHIFDDLCPLTRFRTSEVMDEVKQMEMALNGIIESNSKPEKPFGGKTLNRAEQSSLSWQADPKLGGLEVDELIGSHSIAEFANDITQEAFREAWAKGDPIVVHGCLEPAKLGTLGQAAWGPWRFTRKPYDQEKCYIVRCEDGAAQVVSVSTFFSTLGQSQEAKIAALGPGIWKLKDWPPSAAFDETFPDLYQHFNAALPVPNYTRRDGNMNISALFPQNSNVPDLGPKMYCAWASTEDQQGKGSTRLHMDMADAVNIMYYSASAKDADVATDSQPERPAVAAWDIFSASDADKLRQYLAATRTLAEGEDPIHVQQHFLDTVDRQRLWYEYGVRSWRIYQKQGDAVFIPAGCAHQVCNLADCMKIAVDFVSPENVARCFKLTSEFRSLNNALIKSWKEDTLQLKSMLWHAWRACRTMEGHDYTKTDGNDHSSSSATTESVKLDKIQPVRERVRKNNFINKRLPPPKREPAAKAKQHEAKSTQIKRQKRAVVSANKDDQSSSDLTELDDSGRESTPVKRRRATAASKGS